MSPARRLPEKLALLVLVAVAAAMAASMADAIRMYDSVWGGSTWNDAYPRTAAVLRLQRKIAAKPPGLVRDLGVAGGAGGALAAFGLLLMGSAGALALRGRRALRRSGGAELTRRIGLLALLVAVAAAMSAWARIPTDRFAYAPQVTDPLYPGIARGFAVLRLGIAVAIAAHLVALVLGFAAARRASK